MKKEDKSIYMKAIIYTTMLILFVVSSIWVFKEFFDRERFDKISLENTVIAFIEKTTDLGYSDEITLENFFSRVDFHTTKRTTACQNVDNMLAENSPLQKDCSELSVVNEHYHYANNLITSHLHDLTIKEIKQHDKKNVEVIVDIKITKTQVGLDVTDSTSDGTMSIYQSEPILFENIKLDLVRVDNVIAKSGSIFKPDKTQSYWVVVDSDNIENELKQYYALWDGTGYTDDREVPLEKIGELNINDYQKE